ncbi:hypothetical protein CDAR_396041 [Caerostris darwini]|uniref:Uncharacterized protein n=1 Tax=Caerostris darwini TaxID=1538125 RepID=A0AAV4WP13_9ARAC|nr:hypothetical protein CDAR_396041 [Caerostris darwini]
MSHAFLNPRVSKTEERERVFPRRSPTFPPSPTPPNRRRHQPRIVCIPRRHLVCGGATPCGPRLSPSTPPTLVARTRSSSPLTISFYA